jgi:ribosomal protein S26
MINAGKNAVYNSFDQNRVYVGLQYGISSAVAVELGYMNSFQQRKTGIDYFDRNIIRLSIYHQLRI